MRIAVVGSGISGLLAAHRLAARHEVVLYEQAALAGGHAHTVELEHEGRALQVDVGFIVYNETTYPVLTSLFAELGVDTRPSDMSFGVHDERTGIAYCGSSISTLFAQPGNLARPAFLGMLRDVLRFNRLAPDWAVQRADAPLERLLEEHRFGRAFRDLYLLPMAAAVWSSTPDQILAMPARFLVRFFANHGFLSTNGHLQWRTVVGGSRTYVDAITRALGDAVRLGTRVTGVRRDHDSVQVIAGGRADRYDHAVLAVHADQALAVLLDAGVAEREVLSALRYQSNRAILHHDESLLPIPRRARASWNYHGLVDAPEQVAVTYDLGRLQGLPTRSPLLLTLNLDERIDPRRILRGFSFEHPVFDLAAVAAQRRWAEVSGRHRVHFCGAYWGNGFHEDGAASALRACRRLEESARAEEAA